MENKDLIEYCFKQAKELAIWFVEYKKEMQEKNKSSKNVNAYHEGRYHTYCHLLQSSDLRDKYREEIAPIYAEYVKWINSVN
jgi:hypothetical protein